MIEFTAWAQRHQVSREAVAELVQILATPPPIPSRILTPKSEAAVQADVRLHAPKLRGYLWRNNVGVFTDPEGVPVRFGLANDSGKVNKRIKSSDLIGFLPYMVDGTPRAIFTAIECKSGAWVWSGTPREIAQQRFIDLVRMAGGVAGFVRSVEEFEGLLTQ